MLKKSLAPGLIIALSLFILATSTEAFAHQNNPVNSYHSSLRKEADSTAEEKDEIMKRDQIDSTDTLAIPFDESEVEDEQQIDWDEKRDVFPLPHSR